MPFLNIGNNGNELTLRVPARSTTDWANEFLNDFAIRVSEHDHTGGGRGAQLGAGSLASGSISGDNILFQNNEAIRFRDSNGVATDALVLNNEDIVEILIPFVELDHIKTRSSRVLLEDVTDSTLDSLSFNGTQGGTVHYSVEGKKGTLEVTFDGTLYNFSRETTGLTTASFSIDETTGDLIYTNTGAAQVAFVQLFILGN